MNKQPRMIDAGKLDEYLMMAWGNNGDIIMEFIDELNDEIESGTFDPDPIPLPTIKRKIVHVGRSKVNP